MSESFLFNINNDCSVAVATVLNNHSIVLNSNLNNRIKEDKEKNEDKSLVLLNINVNQIMSTPNPYQIEVELERVCSTISEIKSNYHANLFLLIQ
jgi:hypothetical protein